MKLFEFDIHIGDWRVLVQSRDIKNGAVQSRHIADNAVTGQKIADKTVLGRNIAPGAVDGTKIKEKTVTGSNIGKEAIQSRHLADNSITGDEVHSDAVIPGKIADDAIQTRNIKDRSVTEQKMADLSVSTRALKEKSVTPEKLSDNVYDAIVKPVADMVDENDGKYKAITEELYSMIASLQVGGIALSGKLGERTDIGIHQKALTKMIGRIWDELGTITGKTYMDFTLTVEPLTLFKEVSGTVVVSADCSEAISDFDSIKIYVNNNLVAESSDINMFTKNITITDKNSTIKAVGTIMGKTITKEKQVTKYYPFFMGGGQVYTDVMNEACQKELIGTLEGDYDATISTSGQYLFVIIPISHKDEFRRCKMDMNGFEIPFYETEMTDYIVCKSKNTYQAGTYNIDIDINS